MTWLGSRLGRCVGQMALGVIATAAAAVLMAPAAVATPESDASDAINQAWDAAGGPGSPVGDTDGDVYQIGTGYGRNFTDGKIFYSPDSGAHLIWGAVLEKYEAMGGPGDSDLGFPNIDEVVGLIGPDSRVSTFNASDKPAIFWTPATGAWVVRGAINAAWDALGGSAGVLGAPTEDERYDGDVVSQKFSGGELSWNQATKKFTTVPPDLAANLTGVEVPTDATTAINLAWRAAGGLSGPLGARQGDQTAVGDNGAAQAYAGGKIFYSPDTGAHAVTGAILEKYEAAGGPTGDLGFPITAEADGGAPNSRVSAFSAPDRPVIFWTPDTGAVVVRGAINTAWTKLGGATGALGVPTADQTSDGDTVTQTFGGGEVSWNEATSTFTTKPADLASQLSGMELPSSSGEPQGTVAKGAPEPAFTWHWWWLLVIIPALLLIGVLVLGLLWLQRRRRSGSDFDEDFEESEYDSDLWSETPSLPPGPTRYATYPDDSGRADAEQSSEFSWLPGSAPTKTMPGPEDVFDGDPDSIDTTPTRIPAEAEPTEDEHAAPTEPEEAVYDEALDTGRHAVVNVEDSSSMWTLDMGEIGLPRRRRAAEEVSPDISEVSAEVVEAETVEEPAGEPQEIEEDSWESESAPQAAARPAIHLPLADPYQPPDGYPIKANTHSGLYYTPESALYHDTVPEVWFASEELAQANGFIKAE